MNTKCRLRPSLYIEDRCQREAIFFKLTSGTVELISGKYKPKESEAKLKNF